MIIIIIPVGRPLDHLQAICHRAITCLMGIRRGMRPRVSNGKSMMKLEQKLVKIRTFNLYHSMCQIQSIKSFNFNDFLPLFAKQLLVILLLLFSTFLHGVKSLKIKHIFWRLFYATQVTVTLMKTMFIKKIKYFVFFRQQLLAKAHYHTKSAALLRKQQLNCLFIS